MKIAMFTNTYLPHVGGVARSVETLAQGCRQRGHEVRIIAPEFEGAEPSPEVLRVPALQNFNGSDFCVRLPAPKRIREFMDDFDPDLIHSHHPFLLGDTALREAWKLQVPIVFTHHTLYERYTHYVPLDSPALKRMAIQLATEYSNFCNQVIAPSESIARLLQERDVRCPVEVVPTGIDRHHFATGDGAAFRQREGIPAEAQVIGHIGRLAEEKNLRWLGEAVAALVAQRPEVHFLLVGEGEMSGPLREIFAQAGAAERLHAPGKRTGRELADAYAALDVFAFTSQSETQGMVLAEAMSAGKPVVALDGPGVRELVVDGVNGFLLPGDAAVADFTAALARLVEDPALRERCGEEARNSAESYDVDHCIDEMLECYEQVLARQRLIDGGEEDLFWDRLVTGIGIEWDLLSAKLSAASAAVIETPATEARLD